MEEAKIRKDLKNKRRFIPIKLKDNLNWDEVSKILQYHIDVRHIRGGESTRRKFFEENAN